ncbi:hypothetical protein T261_7272 [Streptomyces lydicus]|nr:hypothetical protein T261_7272 [Streptomyces lydicus]
MFDLPRARHGSLLGSVPPPDAVYDLLRTMDEVVNSPRTS